MIPNTIKDIERDNNIKNLKDEETYLLTNEAEHDGTNYYSLKRKGNLVIF